MKEKFQLCEFPSLYFYGKLLKLVSQTCYLEFIIANDLSDDEDIKRLYRSLCGKANMHDEQYTERKYKVMLLDQHLFVIPFNASALNTDGQFCRFLKNRRIFREMVKEKFQSCEFPSLYFYGKLLKLVSQTCYLEFIIANDLSDDEDIKRQYRSLCGRANMLIRKFQRCSEQVRLVLFRACCTVLYCAPLWCIFA